MSSLKILLLFFIAVIPTVGQRFGFHQLLQSTSAIATTTSQEITGRFLWIIETVKSFCDEGIDMYSPPFLLKVDGKELHVVLNWYIKSNIVKPYIYHWKTSQLDSIRWRVRLSFLNSTSGEIIVSKTTPDFEDKVPVTTKKDNNYNWDFFGITEFYEKLAGQKDLAILAEVFIANAKTQLNSPADYFKRTNVCQTFSDFGKRLLSNGKFCDTTIEIDKDGNNDRFCVHRAILDQRARQGFKSYIENDKYLNATGHLNFELTDISIETFREILEFIYTDDDPKFVSAHQVKSLLLAAIRFKMEKLIEICLEKISKELTAVDAVDWLRFARENKLEVLKKYIGEYMRQNAVVMGNEKWENLLNGYASSVCKGGK